jgi:myo-inositol-1(or 4)-monophosphatase
MKSQYSSANFPQNISEKEIHSFLLEVSEVASKITLSYFRNTIEIDNKLQQGFDPVTAADREAEQAIREKIAIYYPDHNIFGEEWEPKKTNSAFAWIIDPIDGTRAFISGLPVWGTLAALTHNDSAIAGLMSQPHIGEEFIGVNGRSYLHRQGNITELKTSKVKTLSEATIFTTSPRIFLTKDTLAAYDQLESQTKLARYGLDCYGYAMVAAGHGDLVVEEGLKDVDIAAMIPIVEGAGGIVTDWRGNAVNNGGQVIAAANKELHAQALEILSKAATN